MKECMIDEGLRVCTDYAVCESARDRGVAGLPNKHAEAKKAGGPRGHRRRRRTWSGLRRSNNPSVGVSTCDVFGRYFVSCTIVCIVVWCEQFSRTAQDRSFRRSCTFASQKLPFARARMGNGNTRPPKGLTESEASGSEDLVVGG